MNTIAISRNGISFRLAGIATAMLSGAIAWGNSSAGTINLTYRPADQAALERLCSPYGTLIFNAHVHGVAKLEIREGQNLRAVDNALWNHRIVLSLRDSAGLHYPNPLDITSVQNLKRLTAPFKNDKPELEVRNHNVTTKKEEKPEPDYYQALQYFLKPRAYPYDRVDWSAYQRAAVHEAQMPAYHPWMPGQVKTQSLSPQPLGGQWQYVGPNNLDVPYRKYYGQRPSSGRIGAVAFDPQNQATYYIGGSQGGLWKSIDKGKDWTPLGDKWAFISVSSIAIDPSNDKTIYVGTGDFDGGTNGSNGIEKSTDGGSTWTVIGQSQFAGNPVKSIIINPANTQQIIAVTGRGPTGNGFVWRSTDGGNTWSQTLPFAEQWSGASLGLSGLYVCAAIPDQVMFQSQDFGATWTACVAPGGPLSVAASAIDPKTVYALDAFAQKVWKSTDLGQTWTDETGNLSTLGNWSQDSYDFYIYCFQGPNDSSGKPQDDVMVGLIDVDESLGGGSTWTAVGATETAGAITHNDQHSIAVNPIDNNAMMLGNDGGIYYAERQGTTWAINGMSKNLGVTMFYDAQWVSNDVTRMIGGSQDNATPVSTGDLQNWSNVGGGDGGFVAINPKDPNNQYCTIYRFTVIETTDNWASSFNISPNAFGDNSPFVTPIYQDPQVPKYLYGCDNYLWRYDSASGVWTPRLGGIPLSNSGLVHAVGISPMDDSVIYTGSDDGLLYMSTNQGSSWRLISGGSLPNRSIQSISVDPRNPFSIIVTLSGTGADHVWQCTNTLSRIEAWTDVSGTGVNALPDVSVNCIARSMNQYLTNWYVGTDFGVYVTTDGGHTWQNAGVPLGLPNVQVTSLQMTSTGFVYAATYGRGIWRLPLFATPTGIQLAPSSYAIVYGTQTAGNLASLISDDGNVVSMTSGVYPPLTQVAGLSATFTLPTGVLNSAKITLTSSTNLPEAGQVFAYNWRTGTYQFLGSYGMSGSSNSSPTFYLPTTGTADYEGRGNAVTILVRAVAASHRGTLPFSLSIDHVTLFPGISP